MKVRISTTVDETLLAEARACCGQAKDASVLEQALTALVTAHRAAEIDQRIDIAYRELPIEQPDDWGDLDSFLDAATQEPHAAQPR